MVVVVHPTDHVFLDLHTVQQRPKPCEAVGVEERFGWVVLALRAYRTNPGPRPRDHDPPPPPPPPPPSPPNDGELEPHEVESNIGQKAYLRRASVDECARHAEGEAMGPVSAKLHANH